VHSRKVLQKFLQGCILTPVSDVFKTIASPARAEIRVQGSRFIAQAFPAGSAPEAQELLEGVRRAMHDATHHCYAYCLGREADEKRFSDAGEPSGTAGRPILGVLEREGLTNILLVVTRYFGGTKLGTGGLVRAYAQAASTVLAAGTRVERTVLVRLSVSVPHHLIGELMHQVALFGATVAGDAFDHEAHYEVELRASRQEEFTRALREKTAGTARVVRRGERAAPGRS
jgi:uncharacterized YigZ family protein